MKKMDITRRTTLLFGLLMAAFTNLPQNQVWAGGSHSEMSIGDINNFVDIILNTP